MDRGEGTSRGSGAGRVPHPPTARAYPEVVTRTRNPVRQISHGLLVLFGWILFAVFWYQIFLRQLDRDAVTTFLLLLVVLGGVVFVNLIWVGFNLAIYRRKGSRVTVRQVPFRNRHDTLGRVLEAPPWDQIRRAPVVEIEIDDERGVKRYRVPASPGPIPGMGRSGR